MGESGLLVRDGVVLRRERGAGDVLRLSQLLIVSIARHK